ncbi:hypothetical protein Tdes44962_MAKER00410 [Teratosphaeria destructans]|uniref:Uncharacterized protein n=1 Tax=Teratosphaeria destructans TaxID=418781 RepID=A0A9W7SSA0_9PEZI|nr:hypothetical protein Tdes44962_MAKER00410 [Teratosphaeria destructans]
MATQSPATRTPKFILQCVDHLYRARASSSPADAIPVCSPIADAVQEERNEGSIGTRLETVAAMRDSNEIVSINEEGAT